MAQATSKDDTLESFGSDFGLRHGGFHPRVLALDDNTRRAGRNSLARQHEDLTPGPQDIQDSGPVLQDNEARVVRGMPQCPRNMSAAVDIGETLRLRSVGEAVRGDEEIRSGVEVEES